MIIRVIDFETTGLPPDASVCEVAVVDLREDGLISALLNAIVKPTHPISLEAMAIHHITEEIAQDGVDWSHVQGVLIEGKNPFSEKQGHSDFFAAHNADFEKAFFNPEGSRWLDTWKIALRLWPDSPSHSNQILRYYLGLNLDERAMPPHRALPDAWVTAHILHEACKIATLDDLAKWSNEPPYLTKIGFGKHRGKKFSELPKDYLEWIIKQDMEPGVIAAARRELGSRASNHKSTSWRRY